MVCSTVPHWSHSASNAPSLPVLCRLVQVSLRQQLERATATVKSILGLQ